MSTNQEQTQPTASRQQDQLLQARDQGLQQIENGMLRPHGKLWGMDVFSWYNPLVFELENTLSSFPAPVLWFGNESDILKLISENTDCLAHVKLLCTHDRAGFVLPENMLSEIETVLGTTELKDALDLIRGTKRSQGILLFTASGNDWKERKEAFEFFLDIHQTK